MIPDGYITVHLDLLQTWNYHVLQNFSPYAVCPYILALGLYENRTIWCFFVSLTYTSNLNLYDLRTFCSVITWNCNHTPFWHLTVKKRWVFPKQSRCSWMNFNTAKKEHSILSNSSTEMEMESWTGRNWKNSRTVLNRREYFMLRKLYKLGKNTLFSSTAF